MRKNPGCHLFSPTHDRQNEWKLMNRNGTLVGGKRYLEPAGTLVGGYRMESTTEPRNATEQSVGLVTRRWKKCPKRPAVADGWTLQALWHDPWPILIPDDVANVTRIQSRNATIATKSEFEKSSRVPALLAMTITSLPRQPSWKCPLHRRPRNTHANFSFSITGDILLKRLPMLCDQLNFSRIDRDVIINEIQLT